MRSLAGQSLVVTGATGFLGSAFVRMAVRAGARVTVVSRPNADHWRLHEVDGQYATAGAAIADVASLRLSLGESPIFVHFAAAGVNQGYDDVAQMVATNVGGTAALLLCARRNDASRFVLVGTSGEYGPGVAITEDAPLHPTSEYGATRASATLLARAFAARRSLDVVIVRPFAVYGPYEAAYRLIPHVILGALRGTSVRISSGEQTRDYVHVDDVSAGIGLACTLGAAKGGTFNLCTGTETTVRDAALLAATLTDASSRVEVGAVTAIPGEMWRTSGDPSRARDTLGWQPTIGLRDGLQATIEWFKSRGLALPAYAARTE